MLFIFDMGNVILENVDVIPKIASIFNLPFQEVARFCDRELYPLMKGTVTVDRFWQVFSRRFKVKVEQDYLVTCFEPRLDERMVSLIRDFRRNNHRVVCGTNTLDSHYRFLIKRGDFNIFDAVYASHLMGCAKPDPDFFRRILSVEGDPSEKAVFVDDLLENVQAASSLGIMAFHFQGYAKLMDDFSREGIIKGRAVCPE
ncbi:MAG: HAD-IA family hydrolase [Spirochaetales bacterium]|nr:HAD-IA family hydrolase [Spirochaetales bacterium]